MQRRSFVGGALAAMITGCERGESPPDQPEPPEEAAPRSPSVVWSASNIGGLVPASPTRLTPVPLPVPPLPAYDGALAVLGGVVDTFAADPDTPWAIVHGVLARGANLRLPDGTDAIDHLVGTFGELTADGWAFPRERGAVRVEPHTDLILKNLGEAGISPDRAFTVSGKVVTLADLYRSTLLRTFLVAQTNQSSFAGPNDMPWSVQALAQWAPEAELQWVARGGAAMDLDDLATFLSAVLTQESAWLFQKMQRGDSFEKQGQNLFNYTCGGAHLLQGAAVAVARGFGTRKARTAVEAQVPLWFYRLPIELKIYDAAAARHPKALVRLLTQRMKFLGHFLESLSKLMAMGLFTPTRDQSTLLEGAVQNLTLTIEALQRGGTFEQLRAIRLSDEQLYLDIVGDACHAVRGLELVLGRQQVAW